MYDCIIVGGGVVGASVLDAVSLKGYKALLLEKEDDVAVGASRANSGIAHAGYDCVPNTLKAKFNVEGNKAYPELCACLEVPFKKTGSLVLARAGGEKALAELYDRGVKNGVKVEIIDRAEIDKIQPDIAPEIVSALWAEDAGIVSPYKLTIALCDRAILNGAEVQLNSEVTEIKFYDGVFTVITANKQYKSKFVINAAGSAASHVNELFGEERYETLYKKGEYFVLDKDDGSIKTVLFPLPDERGKGILVAPTADGNVIYGPTSTVCAEGDTTCTPEGLQAVSDGVAAIISKPNYRKVIREYAGVRAQIGEDFIIKRSSVNDRFFILAGICSPGLTSAPAIGKYVAEEMEKEYKATPLYKPVINLHHDRISNMTAEELNAKISENPSFGRIICRCEKVTEAEIINAIHSPLPATTVDAVKRRVRAGMGRCQGGFCAPRVIEILSRELGIPMTAVKKGGVGSELVKCKVKEADDENL